MEICINPNDSHWPRLMTQRLGADAPPELTALGNLDLLALPKTALFCSARCPGNVILPTYDQAAKWRDAGRCVISGFHSPVETECLQTLSRLVPGCQARMLRGILPPCPSRKSASLPFLSVFIGVHLWLNCLLAVMPGDLNLAVGETQGNNLRA